MIEVLTAELFQHALNKCPLNCIHTINVIISYMTKTGTAYEDIDYFAQYLLTRVKRYF